MAESEEELKSLLKKVKEKSEKVHLILNFHKTKIMGSNPITSWLIDGETMETVADSHLYNKGKAGQTKNQRDPEINLVWRTTSS